MNILLSRIAEVLDGELRGEDLIVSGVSTDSRSVCRQEMFIAIRGEKFDAHDFVEHAARRGAACVLVDHACPVDIPQVIVKDTRKALGSLAAWWRRYLGTKLVAITGSNGKTTVKEMAAAILSQCGKVLATSGNLNNDIGVPLTLLRLNQRHQFGVIEMGANHPGEIALLASLARPDVGVVTNAAAAHLEGFGDLDGVAAAKGELFEALDSEGVAVINTDDVYAAYWQGVIGDAQILSFGLQGAADVSATWEALPNGSHIRMMTPLGSVECRLAVPGEHNIRNALAAAAAAIAMGAQLEHIRDGLDGFAGIGGRLQFVDGLPGMQVIDDTYNANPASLQAGLDVLSAAAGNRWLVLGDMGELGSETRSLHEAAARLARSAGVERLYCLGPNTVYTQDAFGKGAMHFDDAASLAQQLMQDWSGKGVVLVKGSRAMGMERIVAMLAGQDNNKVVGNGG